MNEVRSSIGTLSAGNLKFVDRNGDGKVDEKDKTIIGNPNPKFTYGLQTSLTWRDLSFSMAFNGVYGNQILNANARYYNYPSTGNNMILSSSFKEMYRFEHPWTVEASSINHYPSTNSVSPKVSISSFV